MPRIKYPLGLEHLPKKSREALIVEGGIVPMVMPACGENWSFPLPTDALTVNGHTAFSTTRMNYDGELLYILTQCYRHSPRLANRQHIEINEFFHSSLGQMRIPKNTSLRFYLRRLAQIRYTVTCNGVTGSPWSLGHYVEEGPASHFVISDTVRAVLDNAAPPRPLIDPASYARLESPWARRMYRQLEHLRQQKAGVWQHSMTVTELIERLGIYTAPDYTSHLQLPTWNIAQRAFTRCTEELLRNGHITSVCFPGRHLQRVAHFTGFTPPN